MSRVILFLVAAFRLFAEPEWEIKKAEIIAQVSGYQGWCTTEKAELIMELIRTEKPLLCVDIGTFGGATFSVIAKTVNYNQIGFVYAIDPWSRDEAIKGFHPGSRLYEWWGSVNLNQVYLRFLQKLMNDQLSGLCKVCKMTSAEALPLFQDNSIDFLHIDGNHSENGTFFDVFHYYPKVRENGYILLNDANWVSARKSVIYLLENCELCTLYHESMPYLLFKKTAEVKSIADQLWR